MKNPSGKTNSKQLLVLAAVAILILAGGIYYFLNSPQTNSADISDLQQGGMEIVLGVSESSTNNGVTIKVNTIGAKSVSLTDGTETKIIGKGESYSFKDVTVGVKSVVYTDNPDDRKVTLLLSPLGK